MMRRMRNVVVVLFALLVGCGSCSDFFAVPDSGTASTAAPAAPRPAPEPLALSDIPVGPPHGCALDSDARLAPEDEALLTTLPTLSPRPASATLQRMGCSTLPLVALYLEYENEDAARRATYRVAPRVFQGQVAIPVLRPYEVLRRGNVLAVVLGAWAGNLTQALAAQRGFEPALEGRSVLAPPAPSSNDSPLPFMFQTMPPVIDDARMSVTQLDCPADGSPVCGGVHAFHQLGSIDPPRSEPAVYVGLCRAKDGEDGEAWVERTCWLLWSPIGIAMGDVRDLPEAVRLDSATEERLRAASRPAQLEPAPHALREAVLDLGPGGRNVLNGLTRRVLVREGRALNVRGDATRIVVIESDANCVPIEQASSSKPREERPRISLRLRSLRPGGAPWLPPLPRRA